jgi:calcineurin-like phosphoesterase family protein
MVIKLLSKIHDSFMIDYVIHGHVHSTSVPKDMYYNVSCEAINFTPVKLGELICF